MLSSLYINSKNTHDIQNIRKNIPTINNYLLYAAVCMYKKIYNSYTNVYNIDFSCNNYLLRQDFFVINFKTRLTVTKTRYNYYNLCTFGKCIYKYIVSTYMYIIYHRFRSNVYTYNMNYRLNNK